MTEKPLRLACAEAEGWLKPSATNRCDVCGWPYDPRGEMCRPDSCSQRPAPKRRADEPAPYGEDTPRGRELAVEMMHAHRIGVQPAGSHAVVAGHGMLYGAHWEAWADNPLDADNMISACGATVPEAVARCRVALAGASAANDRMAKQSEGA